MFYNQRLLLFLLFSIISITFTSEKLPASLSKIFPEEDLRNISLPYPYLSMTDQEKSNATFLGEGCYTILDNENDCALVGPLRPCQLIVLNLKNGPTIVAHASSEGNLQDLLYTVMNTYSESDFQETTGELFTVHLSNYKYFSLLYENRSQIEELKYKKRSYYKNLWYSSSSPYTDSRKKIYS